MNLGKSRRALRASPTYSGPPPPHQVHQLHEVVQRWGPLASALPQVVQRLCALKDLHEQGKPWVGRDPPPS